MRFAPRFPVLAVALLAAAAFTASNAFAERLTVPFSFKVQGKVLPAGTYVVDHTPLWNMVTLRSLDSSQSFGWVAGPGDPDPASHSVVLRFDESPAGYSLRSVQYRHIVTSRLDKNSDASEDKPVHEIRGE